MKRRLLVPVAYALAAGAGAALLGFMLPPPPIVLWDVDHPLPWQRVRFLNRILCYLIFNTSVPLDRLILALSLSFLAAFAVFRLCRHQR